MHGDIILYLHDVCNTAILKPWNFSGRYHFRLKVFFPILNAFTVENEEY